jgi:hypothetical protein
MHSLFCLTHNNRVVPEKSSSPTDARLGKRHSHPPAPPPNSQPIVCSSAATMAPFTRSPPGVGAAADGGAGQFRSGRRRLGLRQPTPKALSTPPAAEEQRSSAADDQRSSRGADLPARRCEIQAPLIPAHLDSCCSAARGPSIHDAEASDRAAPPRGSAPAVVLALCLGVHLFIASLLGRKKCLPRCLLCWRPSGRAHSGHLRSKSAFVLCCWT